MHTLRNYLNSGFAILCFCMLSLTGCAAQSAEVAQQANHLWENPEPRPNYIENLFFGQGSQCIEVFLGFFTDTGYPSPDIGLPELVDKAQFMLDGSPVDSEGLGNDRNVFIACFRIEGFGEGLHLASITLTNFSGKQVSYSWAFRVNGSLRSLDAESLATAVELPPLVLTPNPTLVEFYNPN